MSGLGADWMYKEKGKQPIRHNVHLKGGMVIIISMVITVRIISNSNRNKGSQGKAK